MPNTFMRYVGVKGLIPTVPAAPSLLILNTFCTVLFDNSTDLTTSGFRLLPHYSSAPINNGLRRNPGPNDARIWGFISLGQNGTLEIPSSSASDRFERLCGGSVFLSTASSRSGEYRLGSSLWPPRSLRDKLTGHDSYFDRVGGYQPLLALFGLLGCVKQAVSTLLTTGHTHHLPSMRGPECCLRP